MKLSAVVFPETVTVIAPKAFRRCSALSDVTITKQITGIETLAFYGCGSLKEAMLPLTVSNVAEDAFPTTARIYVHKGAAAAEALSSHPNLRFLEGSFGTKREWSLEDGTLTVSGEEKKWKGPVFGTAASFAVLDPAYTMSVPSMQVFSGIFDTLSHAMETYLGASDEDNVSDDVALAIMRNTVANMRRLLKNINDMQARSNLMWGSAMAENGILKCGRLTDFQAHQMEHQLGAYTDCNTVEITPGVLRQVADTCNIIKTGPRELDREEIYQILVECM